MKVWIGRAGQDLQAAAATAPHVRAGQQLLHDVDVVNLPAAAQTLLLRVQLLVLLNLKDRGQRGGSHCASWEEEGGLPNP